MNKTDMKTVLKARALLEEAKGLIEPIADTLRDKYEERSDRYKEGEKGEQDDAEADLVKEISDTIEATVDSINGIEGIMDLETH